MADALVDGFCERVRADLPLRGIPDDVWSCGTHQHDRYCIVFDSGRWQIGYSERGLFDVVHETNDAEEALWFFVDWVSDGFRRTQASAEATERWLRSRGEERP